MAMNIPPHNVREVLQACKSMLHELLLHRQGRG
jgi:DNA gyrase/topoisomerase IV subunit A